MSNIKEQILTLVKQRHHSHKVALEQEKDPRSKHAIDLIARIREDSQLIDLIDSLPEEKPSEELEKVAAKYELENLQNILSSVDIVDDIVDAFVAGAEWQAKHSPLPEDSVAFNNGVEEGKRLMMEEAVEGEIGYWNQRGLSIRLDKSLERLGYDMDTKVKIIIIKGND